MGCASTLAPEQVLDVLRSAGCRITKPRQALAELFASAESPVSVPELHAKVNERLAEHPGDEPVNLVTVYRFANLLVERGIARKVEFGQGYFRYEPAEAQDGPHHHHIVCDECGRIADFHDCGIATLIDRLESESGFRIARHQLELYGLCPTCRPARL
ncbi:MAG: Fur family transcriptional regulator [Armatimonadota bacterium]